MCRLVSEHAEYETFGYFNFILQEFPSHPNSNRRSFLSRLLSYAVSWFDLSGAQKQAAREFGYTCHTWEYNLGPSNVVLDECVAPYYKRQWKGLPNEQKVAAKKLKYNETIWDGLIDDQYYDTTWEDLTDYEKDLFKELGYNKFIYNDYFEYEYIALPQAVQNAVQTLLLNGQTWDNCYSNNLLGCTQMSWGSLSKEQQQAAGMVGVSCWDYGGR